MLHCSICRGVEGFNPPPLRCLSTPSSFHWPPLVKSIIHQKYMADSSGSTTNRVLNCCICILHQGISKRVMWHATKWWLQRRAVCVATLAAMTQFSNLISWWLQHRTVTKLHRYSSTSNFLRWHLLKIKPLIKMCQIHSIFSFNHQCLNFVTNDLYFHWRTELNFRTSRKM